MKRELEIQWPELQSKIVAEFLWEDAPRICETIWRALPFESISVHAMISGQMFYNPTKIHVPQFIENVKSLHQLKPGEMTFSPVLSSNIVFIYGIVTEPMDQCIFAKVKDSDLENLKKVGVMIWENMMVRADLNSNRYIKKFLKVIYRRREI